MPKKETVSKDGILSLDAAHDINGEPTRFRYSTFIHVDDVKILYMIIHAIVTHLYYKDIEDYEIIKHSIISEAESVGIDSSQIQGLLNRQLYKEFSNLLDELK